MQASTSTRVCPPPTHAMDGVPDELLRMYYQGIKGCALSSQFPEEWRRVIYVLLRKPKGDQRLVAKRRDIALMCQGMKILCRMILLAAFPDTVARVHSDQLGWVQHQRVFRISPIEFNLSGSVRISLCICKYSFTTSESALRAGRRRLPSSIQRRSKAWSTRRLKRK